MIFPGGTRLTGALTVSEILQRSSIARVEVLGSGPADPSTVVETGDFVRPQFRSGELVLVTTPAAGGGWCRSNAATRHPAAPPTEAHSGPAGSVVHSP